MPKPRLHASHREHREQGESSLEKKSPKDPHRHHHQKKTDVKDKAAVLVHETSSRGQSLLGGAISGPTRSVHDCCGTYTVQYVSGGVRRQAELKVPVLQLMDVIAGEIRVMTSSQLPGEDSKAKQQNAAPVCLKHKVPAASDTKPIPVRVTRNHSPPFCKAGLACKRLQKKVAPKENRLQALQQQEIYEDVSDVPLEEYCDASGSADSTQANVSTGAAVNKPCQPPHKQHQGAPLEKGAAVNKPGQPPHKKHKGAPLEDYEDISDTPLDEYDPSDKPVQSASVADVTNGKVAKAHGKIVGSKPGDSTSKKLAPSSKVLVNKAEKKGPPEAQSSVRTSAAEVQPNEAKSKLTSKPSASSASGKDMVEKRAVKRPGMPCKDHDTKRVKIDADAAEDKTEPGAGTAQKSNSGSSLTKKASLAKPASKLSPCAKNITATCGLKETSTTKLKVGVTETVAKINTATSSVEKKNCLQALNKAEPDNLVKKPMSCDKSSSDVSTSNVSRKVHVSSAPKTAKDVTETKVKHASEGAHGNSTPSVTKKVLPSKLEKKPASSMKGNSDIPACKSSCSSTPTKDSITAKIVKSVTGERVSPSVTKKALPSKPVSSHKGSLDVAKSSSQSISTKAALSTPKPVNDKAKVKPVNDSAKLKVSSSTHVSTMAKEASSKLAKRPVSSANATSEASAAASTKALKSAKETQSSDTAAKVDKKPQSDLKSEHIKHADDSGSFSNKGAVKNVNASGSKTKQCSRTVAPAKDSLERKPPTCSASSTEVKISRCKLFSKRKSPERSSSSQIQAAAGRLKSAPECDGNKQQGTPGTLAAKQTEQVPKAVKTQPTESTESSLSVPDSAKTTSPSSTSKGLCESKIQNCHSSNILKVNAAEETGEQSSLQHYTVYKASPKATEVLTEAVAPTKDHVSKGPTSDIADTVSETAPYGTDSTDKDKSYLQNSCVPAVQEVLAEALDQNATLVVASQDVEAHVAGCVEDLDIGSEVKCQDACPAKNESTIHQDDGHKLQQDPSDTAGQSQKFTVLTATPDGTFPGESTVNSTYHPFGQQDKNTSQVVHDVPGLLHEPGNTEEEQDSALARISTSPAPLQKGLFQAECCTLPSTKMDVDPPTKTEFNAGSLPEQSSVKHAQDGSSVSPPNKTGSDALVLRECDKARDVLLEGASPPSPAGDMPAGTTRDSEMPSSVMQKGLFQTECSTLPSEKIDVEPPAKTEVSAGSLTEQSSVNHAREGSSVSPANKTGSDALVLRGRDKAHDVLLEGTSPQSPAGTTHDSEMPSSVMQKDLFQAECSTLPSTKMDVDPPASTEVSAGSLTEQSSVNQAREGSSVSPQNKTGSDALVVRECDKAHDALLAGASPPSPAGTTQSDGEMPSSVGQSDSRDTDLGTTLSQDPASNSFGADKQGAHGVNSSTRLASQAGLQQIDQKRVALLPKPLCDAKVAKEVCDSAPLEVCESSANKVPKTTIVATLKLNGEVAVGTENRDSCSSIAARGSFQESEEPTSSPILPQQDDAAEYLSPRPTGEKENNEKCIGTCHPATDKVLRQPAEDSGAVFQEEEWISDTVAELPQKLHGEVADTKNDSNEGCKNSDQVQAQKPSTASSPMIEFGLAVSQRLLDTTVGGGSDSDHQQKEALKNALAQEPQGNVISAASSLRPDTDGEKSDGGNAFPASKSGSHIADIKSSHSKCSVNTGPSRGNTKPSHRSDALSTNGISSTQVADTSSTDETSSAQMTDSSEEPENAPEHGIAVVSDHDAAVSKPIPPKKRKKRKSSGTNTSMHSAWLFSRKKRVKRPPKKKQPQKSSSQPAEPSVAVETEVVNSRKAADSMCSRLEGVGSTKKKPPVATVGEVEATSDKVILKGINQKPSYAAAADQAVEDSKFHTTKPLQLSTAPYAKTTSFLQEAMLDLDMFTGLNILDVCGSHTENLKDLKARITNRSITKNEAVAEIAQSVHTAVVEEYFKRERAVRTLNLLARIPFSLDPLEVPKIRNVTQSIVEQSQVRAKVEPGE